jgi:hypothetical protein
MTAREEFVVLMTLPRGVDESIIPGVLASSGIPTQLSERFLARQGRYVEVRVPASRVEQARRVLEDAGKAGEHQALRTSSDQKEPGKRRFGSGAQRKKVLAYLSLWTLGPVVLLMLNTSGVITATCLAGWSVLWIVLFYRGKRADT